MRVACLRVSVEVFLEFCKGGDDTRRVRVVEHGLPADTRFIRAGHDQFGNLFLTLESREFEDIPEHQQMPELKGPVFERV